MVVLPSACWILLLIQHAISRTKLLHKKQNSKPLYVPWAAVQLLPSLFYFHAACGLFCTPNPNQFYVWVSHTNQLAYLSLTRLNMWHIHIYVSFNLRCHHVTLKVQRITHFVFCMCMCVCMCLQLFIPASLPNNGWLAKWFTKSCRVANSLNPKT